VSVPVDGSVQIETTIRAEEKPLHANCCNQKPPIVHVHVNPRGCYCAAPGSGGDGSKLLPLAVLPVALLIWRRKRRSRV
jgi:MYXO-CTERM domain-containing protein